MHLGGLPERAAMFGQEMPRAGESGLVVELEEPTQVTFPEATSYTVDGVPAQAAEDEQLTLPAGELELPPGAVVPVADGIEAQTGEDWARPVESGGPTSPVFVYSLLLATFLGTMGLPHILVRFYTNPDGPAARRTTVRVLGLLAMFYAFPVVYGLLGRVLVPELYITGETDSVVLRLPEAAWPGLGGELLGALVAAGAFAAFMSTASGLMVSVAGTVSFDLWRGGAGARGRAAAALPGRRARRRGGAGRARPGGARARHLGAGRLGVRARGEHVLPAAAARHLVGGPDRARRRGRPGDRARRSPAGRSSPASRSRTGTRR